MVANWEGESLNKWLELKQGLEEELKLVKKTIRNKKKTSKSKISQIWKYTIYGQIQKNW